MNALIDTAHTMVAARLREWVEEQHFNDHPVTDRAERIHAEVLVREWLRAYTASCYQQSSPALTSDEEAALTRAVLNRLFDLGVLQPYLDDPEASLITINGCDRVFLKLVDGTTVRVPPVAESNAALVDMVRRLAETQGSAEKRWDPGAPSLDLRLRDGSRLHALMVVADQPTVTIVKRRLRNPSLDQLSELGSLIPDSRNLLEAATRAGTRLIFSGGPGVGKTTLMDALKSILGDLRIISIEDPPELIYDPALQPQVVVLEPRPPNVEGKGEVTSRQLVMYVKRMRPDVLIFGEVRGDEVIPMLNAMGTGVVGAAMSSVHSDSSAYTCTSLQTLCAQSREALSLESSALLVAGSVDLIVHCDMVVRDDGTEHRWVSSIRQVVGVSKGEGDPGRSVLTDEVVSVGEHGRLTKPVKRLKPGLREKLEQFGYYGQLALVSEGDWQ